ncbi:hypothetical protein C8A03DRAFT_28993 [Achaetomium macrosporum]|uniref:Xylanolytic transcriptional activator regulatory domain-containing protein n=1 Tax=Achaetomium macrosporum TaxID=79813 RepID=A0AAN7HJU8_9PEZI|nr:hypothetical protein C8A03DRAFT_28993 [Achaetomium macrosporum]
MCRFDQAAAPRRSKGKSGLPLCRSAVDSFAHPVSGREFMVSPGTPSKAPSDAGRPQTGEPVVVDQAVPLRLDDAQPSASSGLPVPQLYVDQLLAQPRSSRAKEPSRATAYSVSSPRRLHRGNYSLAFFSDSRLQFLRARLQTDKVNALVRRISGVIRGRLHPADHGAPGSFAGPKRSLEIFEDVVAASTWIELYFRRVHPMYPFLDREWFEATARRTDLVVLLRRDKSLSALYHAVLALGCLHEGCGSFEPGKGRAWRLFSTSLALFPDLLALPDSLTALQAVTAMAVYSSGVSCLSVERIILSEGARRAQSMAAGSNLAGAELVSFRKTFWMLYAMEKTACLFMGRNSAFIDLDIACPVPSVPESIFGELDWFLTSARHARLMSRALASLFSTGVAGRPKTYYLAAIDQLNDELERWRLSIPSDLAPGGHPGRTRCCDPRPRQHEGGLVSPDRQRASRELVMNTARSMLELTTLIDVEPYTPVWVIAGVPIMALFVLIDGVLQDPTHPETWKDLALIDIGGGYFSRLEYASGGSLPGSLITEFAHIAREYTNGIQRQPQAQNELDEHAMPQAGPSPLRTSQGRTAAPGPVRPILTQTAATEGQAAAPAGVRIMDVSTDDGLYDLGSDLLTGTDLMGLFSYTIPGIDPLFWPGPAEMNSLLGDGSTPS